MQVRRFMKRAVLMAGLLAGCGGVEPADAEPPLDTQEEALVTCGIQRWYDYYLSSDYRVLAGQAGCYCGELPVRWGERTEYVIERTPPQICR